MAKWRKTREYREWRVSVIRRDKVCQICGTIKNRQAHHLNHATYFPEQRFDLNNGICLCDECHKIFHTSFKRSYRTKCTKEDFHQYVEIYKRAKENSICEKLKSSHINKLYNSVLLKTSLKG